MNALRRKKLAPGSYAIMRGTQQVGEANLTGRYGADHYPWDWRLVGVEGKRPTGCEESLKMCIDSIADSIRQEVA